MAVHCIIGREDRHTKKENKFFCHSKEKKTTLTHKYNSQRNKLSLVEECAAYTARACLCQKETKINTPFIPEFIQV